MKLQKLFVLILCVVAVLSALPVSSSAINFSAEEKYTSVFVVTSGSALGSGFAVGENCVVTNAHVIDDPGAITLKTYSGDKYKAFLVGYDVDKDIAVLGVEGVSFTPLTVADYRMMNTGDDVYAIGAPKSMAYTLTKGVVSAKERKIGGYTYIQTDAAINEGNSGGPLINEEGNVIGMNTLKMTDSEGIGLAIPMTDVSSFIRLLYIEIDEKGNVAQTLTAEDKGSKQEPSTEGAENPQPQEKSSPFTAKVLVAALAGSVVLNIILIVMLSFQKKKNLDLNFDPRERTDFDIDILE